MSTLGVREQPEVGDRPARLAVITPVRRLDVCWSWTSIARIAAGVVALTLVAVPVLVLAAAAAGAWAPAGWPRRRRARNRRERERAWPAVLGGAMIRTGSSFRPPPRAPPCLVHANHEAMSIAVSCQNRAVGALHRPT
jgi:hypothetical protein